MSLRGDAETARVTTLPVRGGGMSLFVATGAGLSARAC